MDEQTERALGALNYQRATALVADLAATDLGRERVAGLLPDVLGGDGEASRLKREFDRIEALTGLLQRGDELPFGGIRDVRAALKRARTEGAHLQPGELLDVAALARGSRSLRGALGKWRESLGPLLPYLESLPEMPELEREIDRRIDPDEAAVRDSASPELQRIRGEMANNARKTRARLDSLVKQHSGAGILQETGYTMREERYVLAVQHPYKGRVRGIVHDQSASGGTVYIEPDELVVLGNELRRLIAQESDEVRRILIELTDTVRAHLDDLKACLDAVTALDSLQARALYAVRTGASRPMLEAGKLKLVQARHPLLLDRKGLKDTVPLELELADHFERPEDDGDEEADLEGTVGRDREGRAVIITGPNAGGKTVALKTVGLVTALARAGFWPPVGDGTNIPPITGWHVIIGDDQSLEGDLSSFSAHLENLKQVLADETAQPLVLIDEIASGTDPIEGSALAMAFLETAVQRRWWTLVTTHMGALKAFAHRTKGVRNGSMQFDRTALSPTYRFLPDLPGSSYAVEIAQRVGFPESVVARSRELMGTDQLRLEDLIEELAEALRRVRETRHEAQRRASRTAALEKRLRERLDEIEAHKAEHLEKASREAKQLLAQANRTLEHTIKEIREQQASRQAIQKAREQLQQQKQAVERAEEQAKQGRTKSRQPRARPKKNRKVQDAPAVSEERREGPPIQEGDTVRLESGMTGEVLALKGGKLQVAAGAVKLWIDADQVQRVRGGAKKGSSGVHVHRAGQEDGPDVPMELNLIGKRFDEAEALLDKYLEDLALSGRTQARIVHGKGTGTLRGMVQEKLAGSTLVSHYRLGEAGEGGDGVTLVSLADPR